MKKDDDYMRKESKSEFKLKRSEKVQIIIKDKMEAEAKVNTKAKREGKTYDSCSAVNIEYTRNVA